MGLGGNQKFMDKWTGPFYVVQKKSDVTYVIAKTMTDPRMKVVHINRLRRAEFAETEKIPVLSSKLSGTDKKLINKPIIFHDECDFDNYWYHDHCQPSSETTGDGAGGQVVVAHGARRDGVESGPPRPRRSNGGDSPLLPDPAGVSGPHAGQAPQLHGGDGASFRGPPYIEARGASNLHSTPQVEDGGGASARAADEESSRRRVGRDGGGRHGEPPTEVREDIAPTSSDVLAQPVGREHYLSHPRHPEMGGVCDSEGQQHVHDGGVRRGQPGTRYEGATRGATGTEPEDILPFLPIGRGGGHDTHGSGHFWASQTGVTEGEGSRVGTRTSAQYARGALSSEAGECTAQGAGGYGHADRAGDARRGGGGASSGASSHSPERGRSELEKQRKGERQVIGEDEATEEDGGVEEDPDIINPNPDRTDSGRGDPWAKQGQTGAGDSGRAQQGETGRPEGIGGRKGQDESEAASRGSVPENHGQRKTDEGQVLSHGARRDNAGRLITGTRPKGGATGGPARGRPGRGGMGNAGASATTRRDTSTTRSGVTTRVVVTEIEGPRTRSRGGVEDQGLPRKPLEYGRRGRPSR